MFGKGIVSDSNTYEPRVEQNKCLRCSQCVKHCWRGVLEIASSGIVVNQKKISSCIGCLECVNHCPTGAIELTEKEYKLRNAKVSSFYELAERRQSDRIYQKCWVSKDELLKCAEAARLAPTIRNAQQFRFILVHQPEMCMRLAECAFGHHDMKANSFVLKNTLTFAVLIEQQPKDGQVNIAHEGWELSFDMGTLAAYFCLEATDLGLGSCMLGRFDNQTVNEMLGLREGEYARLIIAVGYALNPLCRKKYRKRLEETVAIHSV